MQSSDLPGSKLCQILSHRAASPGLMMRDVKKYPTIVIICRRDYTGIPLYFVRSLTVGIFYKNINDSKKDN